MSTKTTKLVELTQKELTQVAGGHDPHYHSGYYDPAYQRYLDYGHPLKAGQLSDSLALS